MFCLPFIVIFPHALCHTQMHSMPLPFLLDFQFNGIQLSEGISTVYTVNRKRSVRMYLIFHVNLHIFIHHYSSIVKLISLSKPSQVCWLNQIKFCHSQLPFKCAIFLLRVKVEALDGLSSQVTQRATELDHGSLSVVGFIFLLQSTLTILTSDDHQC